MQGSVGLASWHADEVAIGALVDSAEDSIACGCGGDHGVVYDV